MGTPHALAESIPWRCQVIVVLLCLLLPFLGSCSSTPDPASLGKPPTVQQPPKAHLTYIAIGASDTYGIGADDPPTESWPADLAQKLGSGARLVNLGIPGIRLHQALDIEIPVAIDAQPDLVTVWLAVNNLANNVAVSDYSHDLDLLLSRLQAAVPHGRIVVANVPDLIFLPYFSSFDQQALATQVQDYNTAIATLVKRHHVIAVDLYQQWTELSNHPEYISSDGLHPSTLGYTRLAELFYQVLQH